ncbi:MAG: alanine--tRNA ligase [Candidatus Omnitrophica bacterium]|nr:alanine--tRNA ligase [Candidatus Omnitrophota bacterium]
MLSKDIRKKFLEFFRSKKHDVVPSDSLVPRFDQTLLFTSAGMNQFKEQFLGHNVTFKRATSCQKCLRTGDLEKVGETPSHHTFFEMLGNFSFGDYFKKEAIEWAWEFMTKALSISEDRLWVSVYRDDEESYKIWRESVKIPAKKIVKLGAKDNFWPSNAPEEGPNGPCGPCSEIFYDWGKDTGCGKKNCDPSCSCGRFVEVWNLVFTQFERKGDGKLEPLPNKNIDTGMGLERISSVMQSVKTNFETDLFAPVIQALRTYSPRIRTRDLNAIADHIRAVTFAIADGVAPSNEERGYVIRKLIRKAYMRGNAGEPFLYNMVPKITDSMKDVYPELNTKREEVSLVVKEEEEKFAHALSIAMPILEENLDGVRNNLLEGDKIFKLVDTYGIPLEIIESKAGAKKIKLDTDAFTRLMEERREISRKKSKIEEDIFTLNLFAKAKACDVSKAMPLKTRIELMVKEKHAVSEAIKGEKIELMTNPQSALFYTESGGQVGDTGSISSDSGIAEIRNSIKVDGKIIHIAEVVKGKLAQGDMVLMNINGHRKEDISKNHTATHLLHSALRKVLGEHVHQAGSMVAGDRLRFDFTHMKKLSERELEKVESIVNDYINKGIEVKKEEKTLEEARKGGAMALFGEKYGERVTVVSAGDFSNEVCGGTHVSNTKDIGLFKITRESSVASGIRRIEALTSENAVEWVKKNEEEKRKNAEISRIKEEEKEAARRKLKEAEENIDLLIKKSERIKDTKIIAEIIDNADIAVLRALSDKIRSREKNVFVALASRRDGKAFIVVSVTEDLLQAGIDASSCVREMSRIIDGSGGGRADFAQAGGKNPTGLEDALKLAKALAVNKIGRKE